LNAEPRAAAARPGSFNAVELRQVCDGCPVPGGFAAVAPVAAIKSADPNTHPTKSILILILVLLRSQAQISKAPLLLPRPNTQ
jgi:hypothetical protein